jgi:hypothetical protein
VKVSLNEKDVELRVECKNVQSFLNNISKGIASMVDPRRKVVGF